MTARTKSAFYLAGLLRLAARAIVQACTDLQCRTYRSERRSPHWMGETKKARKAICPLLYVVHKMKISMRPNIYTASMYIVRILFTRNGTPCEEKGTRARDLTCHACSSQQRMPRAKSKSSRRRIPTNAAVPRQCGTPRRGPAPQRSGAGHSTARRDTHWSKLRH